MCRRESEHDIFIFGGGVEVEGVQEFALVVAQVAESTGHGRFLHVHIEHGEEDGDAFAGAADEFGFIGFVDDIDHAVGWGEVGVGGRVWGGVGIAEEGDTEDGEGAPQAHYSEERIESVAAGHLACGGGDGGQDECACEASQEHLLAGFGGFTAMLHGGRS